LEVLLTLQVVEALTRRPRQCQLGDDEHLGHVLLERVLEVAVLVYPPPDLEYDRPAKTTRR
jgi:hypothetical protein